MFISHERKASFLKMSNFPRAESHFFKKYRFGKRGKDFVVQKEKIPLYCVYVYKN